MESFSLLRQLSLILWIFLTGGVGSAFADVDEAFLQSVLKRETVKRRGLCLNEVPILKPVLKKVVRL